MPMHIVEDPREEVAGRAVAAGSIAYAHRLSRQSLLRWGAAGSAALLFPRGASASAAPAETPPDADLAYLRLLIGAELLAIDFHSRALGSRRRSGMLASTLRRALADEKQHYATLARLLQNAGQAPATSGDVDFTYPRGSLASRVAIAHLGWTIETLLLGAYLGAIENVQTAELRLPIGQIAANEAQHLSALAPAVGKLRIGRAFPTALPMSAVSSRLDAFES
jgi:ferritin-like protein